MLAAFPAPVPVVAALADIGAACWMLAPGGAGRCALLRRAGCGLDGHGPGLRARARQAGRPTVGVDQRTSTGTSDDPDCLATALAPARSASPVPRSRLPAAPSATTVTFCRGAEAFAEVLGGGAGCGEVSVDAHFFDDLGADSMVDGPVLFPGAQAGRPAVGVDQGCLPAPDGRRSGPRVRARRAGTAAAPAPSVAPSTVGLPRRPARPPPDAVDGCPVAGGGERRSARRCTSCAGCCSS